MIGDILAETEVVLLGNTYLVYLKEVASKLGKDAQPKFSVVRAFVKKKVTSHG